MMRRVLVTTMLVAMCQAAYGGITDELELYLKFDESQGRTAADSSGNGRDAFVANGREADRLLAVLPDVGGIGTTAGPTTTWYWGPTEGKFDGAFLTSGLATANGTRSSPATEHPVNTGQNIGGARAVAISQFGGNLNATGSNPPAWTVSFWTKNAYFNEGQDQVGYFQGWDNKGDYPGDATTEAEYQSLYGDNDFIETDRMRTTAKFNEGRFDNRVNAGTDENVSTTQAFPSGSLPDLQDGEWHHVAVIYDNNAWNNNPPVGDTTNNDEFSEVMIFVDGVEALELRNQLNGGDRVALGGIVIGSNFTWKGNGGDGQYVDDFALWNRELSRGEIRALGRDSLMNIPEPSTLALGLAGLLALALCRKRSLRSD